MSFDVELGEPHVYRRLKKGGCICMARLEGAIAEHRPAGQPRHPCFFHGEWYCTNSACEVRQVRTSLKFHEGPPKVMPPVLRCPVCASVLKFHHYLVEDIYIRDEEASRMAT
jgi:hypothetical protein